MKLHKPPDSSTWHVGVESERGDTHYLDLGVPDRSSAEALVKDGKLAEIQATAKLHRLTADVVSLITANRLITVDEAISEWLDWSKIGVAADSTRANTIQTMRQWAREMVLGSRTIGSIEPDDIHKWLNRPESTIKRGTRLLRLSCIRSLMKYCLIKRYIMSDPSRLVVVDHHIMNHELKEVEHKRVFTDVDMQRILSTCKGEEPPVISKGFFRAAITIGRDLGLRLKDICCLEWRQFDYVRNVVTVWMSKTGERIELPMTQRIKRMMAELKAPDEKVVFPNERAIVLDTSRRAILSTAFSRLFSRLGYDGRSFHSLRATYSTVMANQGMTMDEIAEKLGHKGTSATPAYIRVEDAAKVAMR